MLITKDKKHSITSIKNSYTLTIKNVNETDDAEYKATATNDAGSVSCVAEVLVNPKGWWSTYMSAALLNHITSLITFHTITKAYESLCMLSVYAQCLLSIKVLTIHLHPSPLLKKHAIDEMCFIDHK